LSKPPSHEEKDSVFNQLGDRNEVQSAIPSSIKWFSTLHVKIDGSLRVKRRIVVFTSQQDNSDTNKEDEQEKVILLIMS